MLNLETLGTLLDKYNNQVHNIEDMYVEPNERFQAKLHLVKGMLDTLGIELTMLEAEKKELITMQEDEQEQLDLFRGSHEEYKFVMDTLFHKQ